MYMLELQTSMLQITYVHQLCYAKLCKSCEVFCNSLSQSLLDVERMHTTDSFAHKGKDAGHAHVASV